MRPDRWSLPVLLVFAAVILGAGLGLRDPMPPDEPRFALMARDMVQSGDWLFPRRGSELYAHKPPMFMWLQAAAYALTGNLRVAFLLPSLLASLLTLGLVWDLTRRLWNRRTANWAALALLTTIQFSLQARRGQIDAVVVAMITASMYGFLRHYLLGSRPRWAVFGWFMAGLGTITKGVGFLPLLALPLISWARRSGWRKMAATDSARALRWLGPVAFVAATALWLVPMLASVAGSGDAQASAYAHDLLFRQTATRYANPWHHHQPPWYFLTVIATLWLPFALALPALVPAWRRRLRRHDARILIVVGWVLLVLLFFSASPGKREVYILPALPMLCIAAAPWLPRLIQQRWLQGALLGFSSLLAVAALYAGLHLLLGDPAWLRGYLASRGMSTLPIQAPIALVALGVFGLAAIVATRRRRAPVGVLAITSALWLVHGYALMPAVSDASSARSLMRSVGARLGPDAELGFVAWREQHLLQADRVIATFGYERPLDEQWVDAARWLREAPGRRWLFLQDDALPACVQADGVIAAGVANRRQFLLMPGTALPGTCDPGDHLMPPLDTARD